MRDPGPEGVSDSYASSEIIIEIIVIAEKYAFGFVLITQVTGLFLAQNEMAVQSAAITRTGHANNMVLPIHATLVNDFTE